MRIALAHDHLISDGGGERVLKAFAEIWPNAPIFTLIFDPAKTNSFFRDKKIITSFLQKMPLGIKKYQWYLALRPIAVESFKFAEFDVVLSDSSALMKGIITQSKTLHINYCHTPTRFLWIDTTERLDPLEKIWPISKISDWYKKRLRVWDLKAANRVDKFIANSKNVKNRIRDIYHRDSEIIYPPVEAFSPLYKGRISARGGSAFGGKEGLNSTSPDASRRPLLGKKGIFFLTGGRLVSYKKYDLVIKAFNKLKIPLKIFGLGPELSRLKSIAKSNIEFIDKVSETEKAELYLQAQAFIHPQIEDFGITAVESMAAGSPVIAYRAGGALETIKDGETGVFFEDQDWQALANAVIHFKSKSFDPDKIKRHAEQFSVEKFKEKIKKFIEQQVKW